MLRQPLLAPPRLHGRVLFVAVRGTPPEANLQFAPSEHDTVCDRQGGCLGIEQAAKLLQHLMTCLSVRREAACLHREVELLDELGPAKVFCMPLLPLLSHSFQGLSFCWLEEIGQRSLTDSNEQHELLARAGSWHSHGPRH